MPNLLNAASSGLNSAISEAHDAQAMVCARSASLKLWSRAISAQRATTVEVEARICPSASPGRGRSQRVARFVNQIERTEVLREDLPAEARHGREHLLGIVPKLQDVSHLAQQTDVVGPLLKLALLRGQLLVQTAQPPLTPCRWKATAMAVRNVVRVNGLGT